EVEAEEVRIPAAVAGVAGEPVVVAGHREGRARRVVAAPRAHHVARLLDAVELPVDAPLEEELGLLGRAAADEVAELLAAPRQAGRVRVGRAVACLASDLDGVLHPAIEEAVAH